MKAFCAVCNRGPLFSWEKHPASTCDFSFCQECGEKVMAEKVATHVIGALTGAELEPTPKGMNCIRCEKPFVGGYLMPGSNGWMCFSCVKVTGAEVVHSDPMFVQNLTNKPQYLHISEPMEPVEFAFAPSADEFDANSLRCCFGLAQAPRCRMKATHIPVYADGQLAGDAYCQDHVPVKKKGSWFVPLRCVRVER